MPIDQGGRAAPQETPRDCVDRPCVDRLWVDCPRTHSHRWRRRSTRGMERLQGAELINQGDGGINHVPPRNRPPDRPINQPTKALKSSNGASRQEPSVPSSSSSLRTLVSAFTSHDPLQPVMIQRHYKVHKVDTGSCHVLFTPALLLGSHPVLFQFWSRSIPFSHCAALSPFDTFGCTARPSPAES